VREGKSVSIDGLNNSHNCPAFEQSGGGSCPDEDFVSVEFGAFGSRLV